MGKNSQIPHALKENIREGIYEMRRDNPNYETAYEELSCLSNVTSVCEKSYDYYFANKIDIAELDRQANERLAY